MDTFSAPRFDLLFKAPEYKPDPNEDANFMANIAALQDPSGTLRRKQAELVAKNMAQVKTDDLRSEFQKFALDEIQKNLDDELKMYQSNKGFNRLALNADQLLEKQKRDKDLIGKVGALKQLSEDYKETMDRVAGDVAKQVITAEEYDAFDKELQGLMKGATGIGDIPSARMVYNRYLAEKPYSYQDMARDFELAIKGKNPVSDVEHSGDFIYNTDRFDTAPYNKALLQSNPKYLNYWLKVADGDLNKAAEMSAEFARSRDVNDRKYAGQVRKPDNININTGSGFDNKKGLYTIPFVKADGSPMKTPTIKGKNGNAPINPVRAVEVMNLESFGKAIPWVGQLTDENGKKVNVNGTTTQIIVDDYGGVYQRINGTYKKGNRTVDITQDIPYNLDYNVRLHQEKIDVDPIKERFGANKKSEEEHQTVYVIDGVEYTKDELGWTDDQIQQALSAKKISKK